MGGVLWLAVALMLGGCSLFGHSSAARTTTTAASPTSSTTTPAPATSSSTSPSSTSSTVPGCKGSLLSVARGRSSGAASTIGLGFVVTNGGARTCTLEGYPTIVLVPASGNVHPVFTETGSVAPVHLAAGGKAGFLLEYSDLPVDGQTTCPSVVAVDVTLPRPGGTSKVAATFSPCGAPDVRLTPVLSEAQYNALVG